MSENKKYNLRKRNQSDVADLSSFVKDEKTYKKFKKITSEEEFSPEESEESNIEESEGEENINDKEVFIDYLKKRLKGLGLSQKAIDRTIKNKFEKLFEDKEDSDDEEKKLSKTENDELQGLRTMIVCEKPTLQRILNAHLPKRDKKRCIELFDILKNYEENSEEYDSYKLAINNILDKQLDMPQEDIDKYDDKEAHILNTFSNNMPLKYKILDLQADFSVKRTIYEKWLELEHMKPDDKDYNSIKTWIEWSISMPYDKKAPITNRSLKTPEEINQYLFEIKTEIDKRLYGLTQVKEAFLEELNNKLTTLNSNGLGTAIALCGSAGTGKTRISQVFAEVLGMPFDQISFGGVKDTTLLHGSESVNIGSTPGIIVKILKKMKYNNGVILFDEIDKLGDTPEGKQVQYALLHITDFTQNKAFRDTYLSDIKIDLSNLWFIYAMNDESTLDEILLDRLPIIKISPYNQEEKKTIITNYMLPNILKDTELPENSVSITDEASYYIISRFGSINDINSKKSGLRGIGDKLKTIVRKLKMISSITLVDGTTGKFKLSYHIPNFKFPFKITKDTVDKLISTKEQSLEQNFLSMYL